jgi:hypothetical protein
VLSSQFSVLSSRFFDDYSDGVADFCLLIPRRVHGWFLSSAEFDFIFWLRANQNVRAKERPVNSVFLVQLRKMVAGDFCGSRRIKNFFRDALVSRSEGLSSVCGGALGEKAERGRQRIVHRGCTGNAERQWLVVSG